MSKYIIEIEDEPVNGLYRAKNFNTLVFDRQGLGRLEKIDNKRFWYLDADWNIQCGEFRDLDKRLRNPGQYNNYFFSERQAERFKWFCESGASWIRREYK